MALQICQLNHRHPACPTCRFSMQNWCPYMSMADRKMDSTWLCRSSYEGRWEAMRTCRARSATLALVVLLSCVSSVRMAMSSSVRVGSRPHSWSYREKLGTNILIMSGLESQIKCKCFIISQLLLHLTIHWLKTTKQSFILTFCVLKFWPCTHNQHGDQRVLLCYFCMREYVVEHIGHVPFVFLS